MHSEIAELGIVFDRGISARWKSETAQPARW